MMITMVIRLILARLKRQEVIKTFEDQPLGTDINLTTNKWKEMMKVISMVMMAAVFCSWYDDMRIMPSQRLTSAPNLRRWSKCIFAQFTLGVPSQPSECVAFNKTHIKHTGHWFYEVELCSTKKLISPRDAKDIASQSHLHSSPIFVDDRNAFSPQFALEFHLITWLHGHQRSIAWIYHSVTLLPDI